MPPAVYFVVVPAKLRREGGDCNMAKGEELVKYVTQRVVTYMDTPPEERKQRRMERKQYRESWESRWFGMLPMAISLFIGGRLRKKTPPDRDD
jgi:hypothetical protein